MRDKGGMALVEGEGNGKGFCEPAMSNELLS
jgi:hypothetical protein